ncbi:GDSL esterase/lipase [Vitis vinifera]|uniref:GDSL esterase/lipase n=1 Tax=Vitis vinifera TaxID=29760 RepID=A0A438EZG1_VITVI|nr:GDSL esterase/lipase [Vitis vinifera]
MTSFQGSTKPPVATTVFFGANDAALAGRTSERQHVPVEEYKENLRRIVHHLKVQIPHFMPLDPGPSEAARGLDRSVRGMRIDLASTFFSFKENGGG